MSRRAAARLAWSMWALSLALMALGLFLLALSLSRPDVTLYYYWLETALVAVGYSTVGAVVASRMPDSTIGWLFCTIGLLFGVIHFTGEYAMYTLVAIPGSLPAGEVAAWIFAWIWVPSLGLIVFLLLVFPDGRLPGALWRWVARFTVSAVVAGAVLAAFSPGAVLEHPFENPLGIEGLPNASKAVEAFMYALVMVGASSMLARLATQGG
jgi:two-component system, NarL family, sensor kinase